MEVLTVIVAALAFAGAEAAKTVVAEGVKDAYRAVKEFLSHKYPQIDLTSVERAPQSKPRRGMSSPPRLGIFRRPPSGLPANRSNMETISAPDAGYDVSTRPSSATRQEIALHPNLPRNHRENALEPENPSTYATSLKDRPRSLT